MSPRFLKLTLTTLTALSLAPAAQAASNFAQGGGNLSTSVNLNFSIVIPRFVYFRVGSAASVNTLVYSPTPAQMAASTGVLATGGDLGGGTDVTVQVKSNAGNVTLTAVTGTATLLNGANTMAWSTLTPSNPTGSVYSKKELEAIAEICVKHNIYVISDEIYEKLLYTDEPFTSIAAPPLARNAPKPTATSSVASRRLSRGPCSIRAIAW